MNADTYGLKVVAFGGETLEFRYALPLHDVKSLAGSVFANHAITKSVSVFDCKGSIELHLVKDINGHIIKREVRSEGIKWSK